MIIRDQDIGGGKVLRYFNNGPEAMRPGRDLTRDEILAWPKANRSALIENGQISIYPPAAVKGERFIVSAGFGKYNVFQGSKLTAEPLATKEEALALVAELDAKDAETEVALPGEAAPAAPETPPN